MNRAVGEFTLLNRGIPSGFYYDVSQSSRRVACFAHACSVDLHDWHSKPLRSDMTKIIRYWK